MKTRRGKPITPDEFYNLPDGTRIIRQAGDFFSVHIVFTQYGEKVINSPIGGINPFLSLHTLFPGKLWLATNYDIKKYVRYEGIPFGYATYQTL